MTTSTTTNTRRKVTLTLRPDTFDALEAAAKKDDRSLSYVADHLIADALIADPLRTKALALLQGEDADAMIEGVTYRRVAPGETIY